MEVLKFKAEKSRCNGPYSGDDWKDELGRG